MFYCLMARTYLLCLLFCLFGLTSIGQDSLRYHAFSLRHDNDINFFTDCYFTSGVELRWYTPALKHSPLHYILIPSPKGSITVYALMLTHNMYTPKKIFTPDLVPFDHPYSAYLLLGQMKESYHSRRQMKVTSSFQIGFIGPLAGGDAIQTTLHKNISIADPAEGWDNQIQNDLCLQYAARLENGIFMYPHLELLSNIQFELGVPRTQAILGMKLRIGEMWSYFDGPETSGTQIWQLYGFMEANVHIVNYNAVLQGGFFNENNKHVLYNVNKIYGHFRYGITAVYQRYSVRYGVNINSRTFSTGLWHHWSELTLVVGW